MFTGLSTYLLDQPAKVTNLVGSKDTSKITLTWSLPAQKRLAFTSSTVPNISAVKADYILHANNLDNSWSQAYSTVTMESPVTNAFATATTLQLFVQAGTSSLTSGVYSAMGAIATQTAFDVRVYCVNQSTQAIKYNQITNIQTDSVGVPDAPTSLAASSITQTGLTASWTAPLDRDTTLAGVNSSPYVAQYRLDRVPTASSRYGGALADTTSVLTTATTTSDSATTLAVSGMHPGTTYNLQVFSRNTINPSYGSGSNIASALTLNPTATGFLSSSDSVALDATQLTTLRAPYSASGGYTLDSTTATPVVLRQANLTNTNTYVTYSGLRRTNFTVGDSSAIVGALSAYGGPSTTYYNTAAMKATFNTAGFSVSSPDSAVTSSGGTVSIVYQGDGDQYASGDSTGFYKVINATARAANVSTNYVASASPYSLRLDYTPVGGSTATTPQVQFYVDSLSTDTTVNNAEIIAESGTNSTQISGVAAFTSSAVFRSQWNQTNAANYFLRADKKHADISITNSTGASTLGATISILSTSINASNKYYVAPASNKYATSSTVSNTGLVLAATTTPDEIQFNTFNVPLTAAGSTYDESLKLKVIPYSIYSVNGGTPVSGGFVDSTGTSKNIRIDQPSVALKTLLSNPASANGAQVSSGSSTYPAKTAFTTYDHTQSLLSNSDLQMLNGRFVTPAGDTNAYKAYSSATYYSGTAAFPFYDYSTITSASSSIRYVTFKYTGIITTGQSRLQVALVSSGLTLGANLSSANHTMTCMVDDTSVPTGNMNCNGAISASGLGVTSPTLDGTNCGDISSTVSNRHFFINAGAGIGATVYLRFGIACNVAATITSASLSAVSVFT